MTINEKYAIQCLHADLDTPVSTYLKLRRMGWSHSFLLESVEGPRQWSANSVLGFGAKRVFHVGENTLTVTNTSGIQHIACSDPLTALEECLLKNPLQHAPGTPPFVGGIFGYVAYDAVRGFEPILQKGTPPGKAEVPDLYFFEPELLAAFNNHEHTLTLYASNQEILGKSMAALAEGLPHELPKISEWHEPIAIDSREAFIERVKMAKQHIKQGDIIQVVLSRRFELPATSHAFDVYRGLRMINPSPYMFHFDVPNLQISGASPEVMVRVQERKITVRPIAGTRPRSHNKEKDAQHARDLLSDPKEIAEHIMLVDLGRNDIGRVAVPGSVQVSELMVVENYSHVMHIVSQVDGMLDPSFTAFDALRAAFPAGTLSGAPKVRAMQIIDELENRRRGIYGGAVGYFCPNGDANFGIAIRTLTKIDHTFVMQAGAGIVDDSDPVKEADETEHKARAVFRAAEWAASGCKR